MRYTIKDIPADMRPREKLLRYGPGVLTDQELLAIIIRTGSREANAIQLAESVLYQFKDLRGINNAGIGRFALRRRELAMPRLPKLKQLWNWGAGCPSRAPKW